MYFVYAMKYFLPSTIVVECSLLVFSFSITEQAIIIWIMILMNKSELYCGEMQ